MQKSWRWGGVVPALHLDLERLSRRIRGLHDHDCMVIAHEVRQVHRILDLDRDERHVALQHRVEEVEQDVGVRGIAHNGAEHAVHPRADSSRLGGKRYHLRPLTCAGGSGSS
jgi:hypothetical protein